MPVARQGDSRTSRVAAGHLVSVAPISNTSAYVRATPVSVSRWDIDQFDAARSDNAIARCMRAAGFTRR